MQFIDLQAQYKQLKKNIDGRMQQVLDHGRYILGPEVGELEEKLADFVGVKHAITCANGTDALTLAMMVLDVKPGDGVFCPTFTFYATAEVVAFAGATSVFVDSQKDTFNICPVDLERQIEKVISDGKLIPKAIIAVDLFGLPANYTELERIANKYNLVLIEDAAQGLGGQLNGKMAGSFGDIATTSFFPAKPLGCYGDGGAVFTNNDDYAEVLRSIRVHGKGNDKYHNVRVGVNSRLDTLQAAVLLEKLAVFPQELINRNKLASAYSEELADLSMLTVPSIPEGFTSSWAQYTIVTPERQPLIAKLKDAGVPTAVYYDMCMHQQPVFKHLENTDEQFPVAAAWSGNVVSLPMHPYMQQKDFEHIIKSLKA